MLGWASNGHTKILKGNRSSGDDEDVAENDFVEKVVDDVLLVKENVVKDAVELLVLDDVDVVVDDVDAVVEDVVEFVLLVEEDVV